MAVVPDERNFRTMLDDIEKVLSVKKNLAPPDEAHVSLSRVINDLSKRMHWRYLHHADGGRISCIDQCRLLKLCYSTDGMPQTVQHLKKIMELEDKRYSRSTMPIEDDTCHDVPVHQGLLQIWGTLLGEEKDRKLTEGAVVKAFDSHSRDITNSQDAAPSRLRQEQGEAVEPRPWSVVVNTIIFPRYIFKGVRVGLVHDLRGDTLNIHIQETLPEEYNSMMEIDVSDGLSKVYYSASKKYIQIPVHENGPTVDIIFDSTAEGQELLNKIKMLCECDAGIM
ncbi:MAG: hypothetical protein Q9170_007435 [Blastenia crenularia]